jgi:hypothetical protein
MPTPELTTEQIIAAYQSDDPRKMETMSQQILTHPRVRAMLGIANKLSRHEALAQHAVHEALLALIENISEGRFQTGNWMAYLRQIFWFKYSDLANESKLVKSPKAKKQLEETPIDSREDQEVKVHAIENYWVQPFTPASLEMDTREGYELAFKIFDHLEPCRRDQCSLICRLRVEEDWDYNELLEYLDRQDVAWEHKPFTKPYTEEIQKIRNQRLRDRVRECWRRLRDYLLQHPALAKTVLENL